MRKSQTIIYGYLKVLSVLIEVYHILMEHHPKMSNKKYYAMKCVSVMADCSEIREMLNQMIFKRTRAWDFFSVLCKIQIFGLGTRNLKKNRFGRDNSNFKYFRVDTLYPKTVPLRLSQRRNRFRVGSAIICYSFPACWAYIEWGVGFLF